MNFEILKEQRLENENRTKIKVKVEAPFRKNANEPYIVFNDQKKVVDFIISKGYTFDIWRCLKAETVHNRGDESQRQKVWSFSLDDIVPVVTDKEIPSIETAEKVKKDENIITNVKPTARKRTRRRRATKEEN